MEDDETEELEKRLGALEKNFEATAGRLRAIEAIIISLPELSETTLEAARQFLRGRRPDEPPKKWEQRKKLIELSLAIYPKGYVDEQGEKALEQIRSSLKHVKTKT